MGSATKPALDPAAYVRHLPTCAIGRCAVCRQPRGSELHYSGTPDSHVYEPSACNCRRGEILEALKGLEVIDHGAGEPKP